MRRRGTILLALIATMLAVVGAGRAITFGQVDTTNRYSHVGAAIAEFDGVKDVLCSGTLISPTVFLTASHCTAYLESIGTPAHNVWVTFDRSFSSSSQLIRGTYHTNPLYGTTNAHSEPYDIAVIVLDSAVTGATPARLPTLNYLDSIALKNQRFTAVGYGVARDDKTKGQHSLFFDGQKRYADQSFRSLTKSWLNLSMNPSIGSGGTCYGDSGGPHFLGSSNLVVAITVTGDRFCRSTDVTYRTDTASARNFLKDYVTLP
jgi:secreted trypsin-like serine protease